MLAPLKSGDALNCLALPGTSGFLQSLDQYNAKFHRHYNNGRDAYKEAYAARNKTPLASFGLVEFLKVLGGDAE